MSIVSNPGFRSWYPSIGTERWQGPFQGCSPYFVWFVEMGYPNLDIREWDDGEWALVEYYSSPNIPALTRWNYVLTGLRNIIPSPGFVTKYVLQLDLQRKAVWDLAEAKTRAMDEEKERLETHAQDTATRATAAIMQNPGLVERIAKEGVKAIDFAEIRKHIPREQLIGGV